MFLAQIALKNSAIVLPLQQIRSIIVLLFWPALFSDMRRPDGSMDGFGCTAAFCMTPQVGMETAVAVSADVRFGRMRWGGWIA